jgi:ABC-type phosphate transport system substrate-binding protein
VGKLLCVGRKATIAAAVFALLALIAPARTAQGASFPLLEASGSSFAAVAVDQWVGQASADYGFNINFQVSSSQQALSAFAENQDDFGASDLTYAAGDVSAPTQPYQYLPDVAGALAFTYNLIGVDGQQIKNLVLNAQTIDGIFSGAISYWDDPSIKTINPSSVASGLPHTRITPVYREDSAGESYLLSSYLLDEDGATFRAYQGAVGDPTAGQPSATWPISPSSTLAGYPNYASLVGQNGSDGVANYVSALSSEGSIGYLETSYAIQYSLPVASLVNASGNAVQPSSQNDATALEKATFKSDLSANLTGVFRDKAPTAYPLSGYSYVIAPCNPSLARAERPRTKCSGDNSGTSSYPTDRGAELAQFLNFAVCAGQEKMALLGYTILPPRLVAQAFSAIDRINGAVEPRSPTAENCPNPYVDGELHLLGHR